MNATVFGRDEECHVAQVDDHSAVRYEGAAAIEQSRERRPGDRALGGAHRHDVGDVDGQVHADVLFRRLPEAEASVLLRRVGMNGNK